MNKMIRNLLILLSLFLHTSLMAQTANLAGTIFSNNAETSIRTGGFTISVELSGDEWNPALGENNDTTTAFLAGFTGNQNWSVVSALLNHSSVVRNSNTLVTVTLPPTTGYYIDTDENVQLIIPVQALNASVASLTATPFLTITNTDPTIAVTGSIEAGMDNQEGSIRTGGGTIVLALDEDEWVNTLGENNSYTLTLISNISGGFEWNTKVKPAVLGSDNGASSVSVSGQIVTITLPPVPTYDISADEIISINIPASLLEHTGSGIYPGNKSLVILSTNLTGTIIGNKQICAGDSAEIFINLTGRNPWAVYISGGGNNFSFTDINSSSFSFKVAPEFSSVYVIDSITDSYGLKNTGSGSANITVNHKTDVTITNLNTVYSLDAPPFKLEATPPGGIFSGPGVISTSSYFYPSIADTLTSPHTIKYTFTNSFGCVSRDSVIVSIVSAKGQISIGKNVYCDYGDPFLVTGSNTAGDIGSFHLRVKGGGPSPGLIDNNDNTASVNPQLLQAGVFTISYTFFDETIFTLYRDFEIESVPNPEILALYSDEFCRNQNPFRLEGNLSGGVFSGPGVTGDTINGFIFNPTNVNPGGNTLHYTYTTQNGCFRSENRDLTIHYVPTVVFEVNDICIGKTDTAFFTNNTTIKDSVVSWSWNFGDINSGADNLSALETPSHIFTSAGNRTITLDAHTSRGCKGTLLRTIEFGDKPTVMIQWTNECFSEGESIPFTSVIQTESQIAVYDWKFYNTQGNLIGTQSGSGSVGFLFSSINDYYIELFIQTNLGCSRTAKDTIVLRPTIILADGNYSEDFENDAGRWSSVMSATSQHNSWKTGIPDFMNLNQPENNKAWYTALPDAALLEQSWVLSPCFNFMNVKRPMISMDILRSMERDREGAVLQSTIDNGQTWQNIGTLNDGINWYNSFTIRNRPGGQDIGWTGKTVFTPDTTWVQARRGLDALIDKPNVQFRIAFATDGNSVFESDGFAFDNVWIGERTRNVLVEHFTNSSDNKSKTINTTLNTILQNNKKDIVNLQYHTDFPGMDPMNIDNRAVPASRSLFYGVSKVPYSIIDGGGAGMRRFDYLLSSLTEADIAMRVLKDPEFSLDLSSTLNNNSISASLKVTSLKTMPSDERIVHVVVYEKEITGITGINGETVFKNVVKDMLPDAGGTSLFNAWAIGEEKQFNFNWNFSNVYNPENLQVAAFIQHGFSREVYQSATDDTSKLPTSTDNTIYKGGKLTIYPNPVNDWAVIVLPENSPKKGMIQIVDMAGRSIKEIRVENFDNEIYLYTVDYDKGVYLIRHITDDRTTVNTGRIVILKK